MAATSTYTFLPKNLGNAYFDTSDNAGKAAIESFGGTYQEVGPDKASPDAQVPFINTAAQQGVAALIVSANDQEAICDALNEARDAGVKVVTFDSDVEPGVPRPVHQPGHGRGHRQGPGRHDRRADR